MANILKFPGQSITASGQEFLQDGDDILRFDSQELNTDNSIQTPEKADIPRQAKIRAKDWTNQELADLFRVKRLLDAAGATCEIDRGITDEGDPWFLFCDANGEVFVHLCRFDGLYVLDSPNVRQPLRGQNFNDLVEQFVRRQLPDGKEPPADGTQRIVRLQRNGKVFLHPATMLAALVWTMLLESDDLVMVLPGQADEANDIVDTIDTLAWASDDIVQDDFPFDLDPGHDLHGSAAKDDAISTDRLIEHYLRETVASNDAKIGYNTYAIGLSMIAISLGFISEARLPAADYIVLDEILALLSEISDGEGQTGSTANPNDIPDFLEALHQVLDTIVVTAQAIQDAVDPEMDGHIAATPVPPAQTASKRLDNEKIASAAESQRHVPEPVSDTAGPDSLLADAPAVLDGSASEETTVSGQETAPMEDMLTRVGLFDTGFQTYTINSTTVIATFEIDAEDLEKTTGLIDSSTDNSSSSWRPIDMDLGKFDAYGAKLDLFISDLFARHGDMEMIALENELIFLDPDILDADPAATFVEFWTLDNGEIISVIGLQSDYTAYDLVV